MHWNVTILSMYLFLCSICIKLPISVYLCVPDFVIWCISVLLLSMTALSIVKYGSCLCFYSNLLVDSLCSGSASYFSALKALAFWEIALRIFHQHSSLSRNVEWVLHWSSFVSIRVWECFSLPFFNYGLNIVLIFS